jgi:type IV pilus assembly protein PilQ
MSAVLNFLAEMSGYNIVASAEVIEGTVTINLKDVPVMTALDTILKTKDLWYTMEKNIITVMTMAEFLESIKARAELTKIYCLQYAIAKDLAETLNNVLGGAVQKALPKGIKTTWVEAGAEEAIEAFKTISFKGKTFVISEERTNSLIVTTDDPANFIMLEALIKKLDTPTLQVLIETQIAEVKLTDHFKFGITWLWRRMGIEPALDARGMMRFDNADQMLSEVGDQEIKGTRRMYDAATGEWTDVDLTKLTYDEGAEEWVETGVPWPMKMVTPLTSDSIAGYKFLILNRHIDVLLQLTKTLSDIDIISNPKIVTANHIKGHIFIGEKIPIVFGTGGGKWTWKWEEVGVTLDVTPHINEQGETTLEVKTHVSELGDYRTVFNVPSVITRTVDTKVVVPDGQTLVIGGMMRNTVKEGRTGVPGLMSIPVLKYLFSTKTKEKEKMEYIFFLTPRVIMAGREIRPEEIPAVPEAPTLVESSPPAEVTEIEPIKEKERSKKRNNKNKKSKR